MRRRRGGGDPVPPPVLHGPPSPDPADTSSGWDLSGVIDGLGLDTVGLVGLVAYGRVDALTSDAVYAEVSGCWPPCQGWSRRQRDHLDGASRAGFPGDGPPARRSGDASTPPAVHVGGTKAGRTVQGGGTA